MNEGKIFYLSWLLIFRRLQIYVWTVNVTYVADINVAGRSKNWYAKWQYAYYTF